jgi:hemin uptake protein HemP
MRGLPMTGRGDTDAPKRPGGGLGSAVPRIPVADLLAGGREVVLVHESTEYRLRLTSNGKLILTK